LLNATNVHASLFTHKKLRQPDGFRDILRFFCAAPSRAGTRR
jgi:hypothetical protein